MSMQVRRLLLATLICAVAAVPVQAATVSIAPSATSTIVGQSLLVDVNIADLIDGAAPSLGSYDIDVNFDSSILSFAGITFGSGLDVLGLGGNLQQTFSDTNLLNIFELSLDTIDDLNNLQGGAFTLFTLTFDALSAGTSSLSLTLNSLADAEGLAIDADAFGASIDVAPVPLPAAGWMLLSGLLGFISMARRRAVQP